MSEKIIVRGAVILHTPYQIVGDVQVDIIEISHVEDMDHSDGSYGCSTYWRAIGKVHMLDSMIIVRYIANTREDLLMDNWVWEEVGYLEGWSKWVRVYQWYYKPIIGTVGVAISSAYRACKSTVSKYIERICSR